MHSEPGNRTPEGAEPAYGVGSVDTALRLLLALAERDELRLSDAGKLLGVARSTAHRLMQMLVKHGLAEQNLANRAYRVGPTWRGYTAGNGDQALIARAQPVLDSLAQDVGETCQLLALLSTGNVLCIAAAEGSGVVRAGGRVGEELPGWMTAGGQILLGLASPATRKDALTQARVTSPSGPESLSSDIERAARARLAVQRDLYEVGTSAVSVAVQPSPARVLTLDVVLPTARLTVTKERQILHLAALAARRIELAAADHFTGPGRD